MGDDDVREMSGAELVDAVGGPEVAAVLVSRLWAGDPRLALPTACEPHLRPKLTGRDIRGTHIDVIILDDVECVTHQLPVEVRTVTLKAWYEAAALATAGEFDWVTIEGGGAITIRQYSDLDSPLWGGATVQLGGTTHDTLQIQWVDAPDPPRKFDDMAAWLESLREFEARVKKIRAAMHESFGGPAVITEWTVR